jgi:hypothetical protein
MLRLPGLRPFRSHPSRNTRVLSSAPFSDGQLRYTKRCSSRADGDGSRFGTFLVELNLRKNRGKPVFARTKLKAAWIARKLRRGGVPELHRGERLAPSWRHREPCAQRLWRIRAHGRIAQDNLKVLSSSATSPGRLIPTPSVACSLVMSDEPSSEAGEHGCSAAMLPAEVRCAAQISFACS